MRRVICREKWLPSRIQNAVSVAIKKSHSNAEIKSHIAAKT